MRIFAKKPKAAQQATSTKSTLSGRTHFGQSREVGLILHLQRTFGDQAVQRMLQDNAEELNAALATTASTRLAHDFSQVPIHSEARAKIQPKLTINTPQDIYEQEADRVADQVMRMPEPQPQRACARGGMFPNCRQEDGGQEQLQIKHVQALGTRGTEIPPSVHEVLCSRGQPMDQAIRTFYEPRFAHDFSQVRVHTDAKAKESAKAINALAYTSGNNIVFGSGKSPGKDALTAHELTHVVQQSGVRTNTATDQLKLSRFAGRFVQLAPAGVRFSLNIEQFERRVRRAIARLANVRSMEEETTFVFYSVPILSQIAVGGFSYIDSNSNFHPGSVLGFRFPSGRFSLSLVLDDTPLSASGDVEKGYFLPSGNSGRIGLRLQSSLSRGSDEEVAEVLYHETIHLYSYLLRSGRWFSSSQTGRSLTPIVRGTLNLTAYATEVRNVERHINSFIPLVNQARQSRSATNVTASQVSTFARQLVEEAMVRAETSYFTSVRSIGPGTRGLGHEITVTGGGSFLNQYLFRFEDMLTSADETAISGNNTAQTALRRIQIILDGVYDTHFRLRWGPVGRSQDLPERTPSLAPGFQP